MVLCCTTPWGWFTNLWGRLCGGLTNLLGRRSYGGIINLLGRLQGEPFAVNAVSRAYLQLYIHACTDTNILSTFVYIYIYIYITWQCLFLFKDYNIGMDTTNKSEIENKWYMEIVDMVTTTNRFRRSRSVSNCPAAAFFDFPWQTDRSRLHLYETVPWWLCSRRICMGNKTDTAIYDICIYIYIYICICICILYRWVACENSSWLISQIRQFSRRC
jgi:hypothetical protein